MADKQPRRGRPKGSGIDDDAALAKIARAMASDTALNATSAIRRIGVSDPSAIRRLRDKLKTHAPAKAPATPARREKTSPPASSRLRRSEAGRSPVHNSSPRKPTSQASSAETTPPRLSSPPSDGPDAAARLVEPGIDPQAAPKVDPAAAFKFAPGTPQSVQSEALRLASDAASAMMRLYMHCVIHAAQMNPMLLALQGQTMMSRMMANAMRPPERSPDQS